MFDRSKFSAIILSSGKSSRMKTHKAELMFNKEKNFFRKITDEYLNFGCKEIIIVMNPENYDSLKSKINIPKEIKIIFNEFPEKGRFYSLKKGIYEISEDVFCFIQNIDNPFVDVKLLDFLLKNSHKADYLIPSYENKGGHPILISKKIVEAIKKTNKTDVNMKDFFNRFKKYYAKYKDKKILANINTISDYHLYF